MSVDGSKSISKKKKRAAITVNVNGTRYDVVRRCAEALGYKTTTENDDSFIIWSDHTINAERCAELKPYQRINHFPGMGEIARKDCLARNLQKMQRSQPDEYDFFPKTWNLPADYTSLMNHYLDLRKRRKCKTFICKPSNGAMGNGIHLLQNVEKLSMHDNLVVQEYLERPLIVDGMKFDLRIYVLVLSCDPLKIFLYDDGLMRFSTDEYAPPTEKNLDNMFMHLTNYSINKSSENYENCDDENRGSKRSIKYLKMWMASHNYSFTMLWNSITDIVIKTLIVAEPYLLHTYRMARPGTTSCASSSVCFEILGMDIFIDRKLRPWLLEVNRSPSFGCDSKVDADIKFDVIRTAFSLLNLKPSEKWRALAAQKQLSRARLLKPRNNLERKTQFSIRKTFLRSQLLELRRVSEQTKYEDKNSGKFHRIFPARTSKQADYIKLLNGAFKTFLAGRGSMLEQKSHQGMLQHLRESELLDMLQQCEHEEQTAMSNVNPPERAPKPAPKIQPLAKLRPWSSPPVSPFLFSRYTSSPASLPNNSNASYSGSEHNLHTYGERARRLRMNDDMEVNMRKSNALLLKQIDSLFKKDRESASPDSQDTAKKDLNQTTKKPQGGKVPFRSKKIVFNSIIKYKNKSMLSCSINNLGENSLNMSSRPMRAKKCCHNRFCSCPELCSRLGNYHLKSSR